MYQQMFSRAVANATGNVIREILKLTQQPDVISFAGGLPSPDAFPGEELQEIAAQIIGKYKNEVLQYGTSEGYLPLRQFVAGWVKEKGIEAEAADVLIISGSQQGIDLLGKTFINPGDGILLENPTYLAAIQIFNVYQGKFNLVNTDEQGLIPASLRAAAEKSTNKLVYLVPTFQNPTGTTLSLARRREIAGMLEELGLVLVEDDPYGDLRYSGDPLPAIKAYDQQNRVVYLGSFSKIISPGLRVGFAIGPREILGKMVIGKQTTDVHTSNLSQMIIYEFCRQGLLTPHIASVREKYGRKRDLMLELLDKYFPEEVTWTKPEGGLFIWAELPQGVSSTELLQEAVKEKVAFIPGDCFFPAGGGENTIRLNFSNASPEEIETGISRLGKVMKKYLTCIQKK
ncbi:MAG: PLP-dependent aminotransferase family protein [Bacillota bacterium]|nr:PLP-dependent aminotransferase family protein [Thermanaerosceptrum fracticalcis]